MQINPNNHERVNLKTSNHYERDISMQDNITNSAISHNTPLHFRAKNPCNSKAKRAYLTVDKFNEANAYKRMWIKAVTKECGLRQNEIPTLEALTFQCDPVHGTSDASIGTIQEKLKEQLGSIHYETVRRILHRLQLKGAIRITQKGNKETNYYELIGYEYKLESCYYESPYNLNSPPIPKGIKGEREKIEYKKALPASPSGRSAKQKKKPEEAKWLCHKPWKPDESLASGSPISTQQAKSNINNLKKLLWQ